MEPHDWAFSGGSERMDAGSVSVLFNQSGIRWMRYMDTLVRNRV